MSIMSSETLNIDKLLELELRIANKHMPIQRFSLDELLKMDIPYVRLRDGSIHIFKRSELEKLKSYLSDYESKKLLLPIIIIMKPDLGEGVAVVEDPIASNVIRKLLGLPQDNESKLVLYRPQIAFLRRNFDTIFQFAISIELSEDEKEAIRQPNEFTA